MDSEPEEITVDDLARRGNITSDEYRRAFSCDSCRRSFYGQDDPDFCPYCGSRDVGESENLPGALLLNPGVSWPDDDSIVGGEPDE